MRIHDNWISTYLNLVRQTEPPSIFHIWVAVAIIAASLGRKCQISLGPETFFPNLYIILVGPPGVRKGTAIKYGVCLLEEVGSVKLAPAGRVTGPKLYQELEAAVNEIWIDNKPFIYHDLFVCADELVVFMGERDNDRIGDLCTLYDGKPVFEYKTKNSGEQYIRNPGLWLLGATTPHWIEESMPCLAVGGGMTSRTIFVYAGRKEHHISLAEMPPLDEKVTSELVADLNDISKMFGNFRLAKGAADVYNTWYYKTHPTITLNDSRFLHYLDRLPSLVIKMSMVFSAARSSHRMVEERDMLGAIKLFNKTHIDMPRAFGGLGLNPLGTQTEMVRELLRAQEAIPVSGILSTLRMHLSKWDYDRVEQALTAEKFATVEYVGQDRVLRILVKES